MTLDQLIELKTTERDHTRIDAGIWRDVLDLAIRCRLAEAHAAMGEQKVFINHAQNMPVDDQQLRATSQFNQQAGPMDLSALQQASEPAPETR